MADPPRPINSLNVTALGAWYGIGESQQEIFQYLNFSVSQGKVLGLFGAYGSGKTTLLRVLAGIHDEKSGHIDFPSPDSSVGYVPQNFEGSFYPWASLENTIRLVAPHPVKDRGSYRVLAREAMQLFGIDLNLALRPRQCSASMLQQAALVRAFSFPIDVLLADEPFSAMSLDVARHVRRGFVELVRRRRVAAVLALHDLEDIIEICDDVMVIPACPFSSRGDIPGVVPVQIFHNEVRSLMVDAQRQQGQESSVNIAPLIERVLSIKGHSTAFR